MPSPSTCPACRQPLTPADQEAGRTTRCPNCGAEYATADAPPGGARAPRRGVPLLLFLPALAALGVAAYFAANRSRPTDYADPDGVFTARFPNPVQAEVASAANPAALRWGERVARARAGGREYAVAVLDGLNPGDQETGPATRDARIDSVVVVTAASLDGAVVHQRPAAHEGHVAREALVAGRDGRLTALRLVAGERSCVRLAVAGSGNRDEPGAFLDSAAAFFDAVRLGPAFGPPVLEEPPAVAAADLGAAYLSDPAAADARFKGRWVRVTGPVAAAEADGTTLDVAAGGATLEVRRVPRGRQSVPVRGTGAAVTVTGKCLGLSEAAAGAAPRVVLADAVVVRPAAAGTAK